MTASVLPDFDEPLPVQQPVRAAFRAAARAVLRAPAATLAAAALIAGPVAVVTTFDIQERTAMSPARTSEQYYGAADVNGHHDFTPALTPVLILPSPTWEEPAEDDGYDDVMILLATAPIWLGGFALLALLARPVLRRGLGRLGGSRRADVRAYGALVGAAGALLGLAVGAAGAVLTAGRYEESLNGELFAGGWSAGPAELGIVVLVAVAWGVAAAARASSSKRFTLPVAS